MYKWVTIMGIVCLGFVIVLLSLGYALKGNEEVTKVLKNKLDQERLNSTSQQPATAKLTFVDHKKIQIDKLARYKNIIVKNLTCVNAKQCVLIDTKEPSLNCVVAVNTIGASLLMKALPDNYKGKTLQQNDCEIIQKNLTNVCVQNLCQIKTD